MGRSPALLVLAALIIPLPAAQAADAPPFLVSFDGEIPAVGSEVAGARVVEAFPFAGVARLEGPASARAAIARLPNVAGVYEEERIALNMERERQLIAAEPPAGGLWPTGANVTVALVDSGIDASHPAFSGRVSASIRISRGGSISTDAGDPDGHGTHVAGIVGGDGSGSLNARHRGIAPEARLVGVDISDAFTTTNAVRAFAWIAENAATHGIRVVSNSWGREKEDAHYDADDPVIRASDALVAQGIVVVFSAGNRGRDGESTLTTEATNPNVITVGAASGSGRVESYSSQGPPVDGARRALSWTKPDLVAPGTAVVSTRASALADANARSDEERYYTVMNGTSMAAPQVAAAAALLLDLQPTLSPADVQVLLQRSAADLGRQGADPETGYGMLDVETALREAAFVTAGERRVVIETRVPVRQQGSVVAAGGNVIVADAAPKLPPPPRVDLPMPLPVGASDVELWFNWTGSADFSVTFEGPDGPVAFERIGGSSLKLLASAAPGAWRVEARPTSPAAQASYTLEGSVVVREEHVVEVAAEPHGRAASLGSAFGADAQAVARPLAVLAKAPWLVLALAGVCGAGIVVGRRGQR